MATALRPLFLAALLTLSMGAAALGLSGPRDDDSEAPPRPADDQADEERRTGVDGGGPLRFQGATLPADAHPLCAVVARNWDRWAQGRDSLTRRDVEALMTDPGICGENAAALATLERQLRAARSVDRPAAVSLRDDALLGFYADRVRALRKARRTLFAPGGPRFGALELGPDQDDAVCAALGWLVKNRPQMLTRAIHPLSDGRMQVTFPGGDALTVSTPTDAELARSHSAATMADGLWAPVLEKAETELRLRADHEAHGAPATVSRAISGEPSSVDAAAKCAPADVVRLWTGSPVLGLRLWSGAGAAQATDLATLRTALARMTARGSLALARVAVAPSAKLPAGLACAVLDYDPMADVLTLWTPWGTDFTPPAPTAASSGASGAEPSLARKRGVFQMGLDAFRRNFAVLAIEQN